MSTRIIIKNLPHNITPARLKSHFSSSQSGNGFFSATVTDAKLVSDPKTGKSRGFAFVGYRNADDAARAVEWFDGTFVDMRRISVEIAKRAGDESLGQSWREKNKEFHEKRKRKLDETPEENRKRKRIGSERDNEKAATIKELTGTKRKNKLLAQNPDLEKAHNTAEVKAVSTPKDKSDKKDKSKKRKMSEAETSEPKKRVEVVEQPTIVEVVYDDSAPQQDDDEPTDITEAPAATETATSDLDWLRARTSRTLGLDSDSEESDHEDQRLKDEEPESDKESEHETEITPAAPPATDSSDNEDQTATKLSPAESKILKTGRLFVRNLVYGVTEDDLRALFSPYGGIEEVTLPPPCTI